MRLRLLSYNIQYGGRHREAELASVIRAAQPDIVVLQEATDGHVVQQLAALTGLSHYASRPNHSTAFLSRLEIAHHAWHQPRGSRHAFLELELAQPALRIFGLHLTAWFSNWSERRRRREIEALLGAIQQHQEGLHLIAGDFNALAPGEALQAGRMPYWIQAMVWLSGRDVARHTIQHMLDRGYLDAWRTLNQGDGYTFPTWDPHVRLDYVFTPERYRSILHACDVQYASEAARRASDHFPLTLDMDVP